VTIPHRPFPIGDTLGTEPLSPAVFEISAHWGQEENQPFWVTWRHRNLCN